MRHWFAIDPAFTAIVNFIVPTMVVMSVIFFVLAGLLVLNTIYLSTLERVREFGVLIELGAQGRTIIRIVTLESVMLCVGGAALGLVAAFGPARLAATIEPKEAMRYTV